MSTEADLVAQLAEAQRSGTHTVDATPYSALDREAAYRVQVGVMQALAAVPGLLKTGLHSDGVGVVAPIFAANVGNSGAFRLPAANVIGLELEVAAVLGRDIDSEAARHDELDIIDAIDHYVVGVEICGSRFANRELAGLNGGLADSMSALGYCVDPSHRHSGADIHNFDVVLEFGGSQIYAAEARHGFGTVLNSLVTYAKGQHPSYPLKAGTMVTTGSLCGLVPISGTGRVVGRLGSHTVEFDIV